MASSSSSLSLSGEFFPVDLAEWLNLPNSGGTVHWELEEDHDTAASRLLDAAAAAPATVTGSSIECVGSNNNTNYVNVTNSSNSNSGSVECVGGNTSTNYVANSSNSSSRSVERVGGNTSTNYVNVANSNSSYTNFANNSSSNNSTTVYNHASANVASNVVVETEKSCCVSENVDQLQTNQQQQQQQKQQQQQQLSEEDLRSMVSQIVAERVVRLDEERRAREAAKKKKARRKNRVFKYEEPEPRKGKATEKEIREHQNAVNAKRRRDNEREAKEALREEVGRLRTEAEAREGLLMEAMEALNAAGLLAAEGTGGSLG